jgi:RimJ/RimL family protein N-acetyltransferase
LDTGASSASADVLVPQQYQQQNLSRRIHDEVENAAVLNTSSGADSNVAQGPRLGELAFGQLASSPRLFYAESTRLRYRLLQADDCALYCDLYASDDVMRFIGIPLPRARARRSFRKLLQSSRSAALTHELTVVVERTHGQAIGISSLRMLDPLRRLAERGIMLKTEWQGLGLGAECSRTMLNYAFLRHAVDEISVQVSPENRAVEKVIVRSGYRRRQSLENEGGRNSNTWSITRGVWAGHRAPVDAYY